MRLEVVTQLPLGDKDGVQEFLDLGVASLGIGQDHQGGADHLHGGHNVEQKRFPIGWGTRIEAFIKSCLTLSSAS